MQHDEFIGQVQSRARFSSRDDAEHTCRATLETLGERAPEGLADKLASQLPREIGEHLKRTEVYAGAVTEVVDEATRAGLMAKVTEALLDDIRQLVTADSTGNFSDHI